MNDSLDIRPIQAADIPAIARLMLSVHGKQTRLNEAYLTWQYVDNPDGEVVGFNAWDGAVLVAHYACMPVVFSEPSADGPGLPFLWSLNTATHPDFRGQGLFMRLAESTYKRGLEMNYVAVIGVANAQSVRGFIHRLGFQSMGRLKVYLSLYSRFSNGHNPPSSNASEGNQKEKDGTVSFARRLKLDHRLRYLKQLGDNSAETPLAKVSYRGIPLVGKTLRDGTCIGPHIYVGLRQPSFVIGIRLPEWLKPSPWVVVYRTLGEGPHVKGHSCCSGEAIRSPLPVEQIQVEMLDSDTI